MSINEPGHLEGPSQTAIAAAFSAARRLRRSLAAYPGALPASRIAAYAIQDGQIAMADAPVVGWKVARTALPFRESFGEERLAGPVFRHRLLRTSSQEPVTLDVFEGGFAAVEAEFVAVIGSEPDRYRRMPTVEEAARHVLSLHIGIELAGSPLAMINDLGPVAVASDCGNNDGVILGPAIADWSTRALESLTASVSIDGMEVGTGSAANVPGGPMAAVAFLIGHLEKRGRSLKVGDVVSTGAATGIHAVMRNQNVRVDFGPDGCINMIVS